MAAASVDTNASNIAAQAQAQAVIFNKIAFLGTNSALPTKYRNTSCIGVTLSNGQQFLIDCGEATQHTIIRYNTPMQFGRIAAILFTHLHGDHCFGAFGLLATIGNSRTEPLTIVGPIGIKTLFTTVFQLTHTYIDYQLNFVELEGDQPISLGPIFGSVNVTAVPLTHRVHTFGYVFTEPIRPGALDVNKAIALGVPRGKLLGQLKAGNDVQLENGTVVRAADCVGQPIPGKSIALLQDTCDSTNAIPFCSGIDVLIHEATYEKSMKEKAIDHGHSTTEMIADFVAQLPQPPKKVVLTHFSSRYFDEASRVAKKAFVAEEADAESSTFLSTVDILLNETKACLEEKGLADKVQVLAASDLLVLDGANGFNPVKA